MLVWHSLWRPWGMLGEVMQRRGQGCDTVLSVALTCVSFVMAEGLQQRMKE